MNVRGEQQADFDSLETLQRARVFTRPFIELDQHEMSTLATLCQDRGLASLFKSCMKIYESENNQSLPTVTAESHCAESTATTLYGTLILVHHMNNVGHYSKWLKKTTKSFGCNLLIKCLKHSTHVMEKQSTHNVTVVLLLRDSHGSGTMFAVDGVLAYHFFLPQDLQKCLQLTA